MNYSWNIADLRSKTFFSDIGIFLQYFSNISGILLQYFKPDLECFRNIPATFLPNRVSTARLELYAAPLLAKLTDHSKRTLHINNCAVHLWSDSNVALALIRTSPHLWLTFVSHRTAELSKLIPDAHWHHIDGNINLADALNLWSHEFWMLVVGSRILEEDIWINF